VVEEDSGGLQPLQWSHLLTNNQSSLAIIKNGATSNATKHIDIVHHATHDAVVDKKVSFDYTPTAVMAANYLTKPCPTPKFKSCLKQIGMRASTSWWSWEY
jgi:hypothetical protein